MSTLILKTYCGNRLLETYGRRPPQRLITLLKQPEFHNAGAENAWGTKLNTADTFVLYTMKNQQVFKGNVLECMAFLAKCR